MLARAPNPHAVALSWHARQAAHAKEEKDALLAQIQEAEAARRAELAKPPPTLVALRAELGTARDRKAQAQALASQEQYVQARVASPSPRRQLTRVATRRAGGGCKAQEGRGAGESAEAARGGAAAGDAAAARSGGRGERGYEGCGFC